MPAKAAGGGTGNASTGVAGIICFDLAQHVQGIRC